MQKMNYYTLEQANGTVRQVAEIHPLQMISYKNIEIYNEK